MAKKSKIQTRKEDALSIVEDSELVEEIDKINALEAKSDVLVEMSDTDDDSVTEDRMLSEQDLLDAVTKDALHKKDTEEMSSEDEHEADMEDDMDGKEPKDKKKKAMMKSLTSEDVMEIVKSAMKEMLPFAKALEENSKTKVDELKTDTVSEKSVLDLATDGLYNSVKSAIELQGATLEQRLESVNPALSELGNAITAIVRESMGALAPAPVSNEQGLLLESISSLTETVKSLATEVATMKAQAILQPNVSPVVNKVPVPRSISPTLVKQSQAILQPVNPNSIHNITRRSVSKDLPLE
jgi:hypothetical protein